MEWTIRKILEWSTNHLKEKDASLSPRLDVELLLAHALSCNRMNLYCDMDRPLNSSEREHFKKLFLRRCNREPIAYILNHKEFYGLSFFVDSRVLIPRPETELIVDYASKIFSKEDEIKILDIGTGSGCLAISLAKIYPKAQVTAIDISEDALQVAKKNAELHECYDRFQWLHMDARDLKAWSEKIAAKFDLIVANLPYVPEGDLSSLASDVKDFEPHLALFAGRTGTEIIDQVKNYATGYLNEARSNGSYFICEVGQHQASILEEGFRDQKKIQFLEFIKDFSSVDRHLVFKTF